MVELNTDGWTFVGESSNTRYYSIERGILAVVPHAGARETGESARENQIWQNAYFRDNDLRGVVVVFADRMASLDKDARRVYQKELDAERILGATLVGMSLLSRAIGSFFLGLSKPRVPLKLCKTYDEALAWARSIVRTAGARDQEAR